MKTFSNASPRDAQQAVKLAQDAHKGGKAVSFSSGGSDLLALVKERIVKPDVIVSLRGLSNANQIAAASTGLTIGGETT
ncbi:MAG TPA: FAD binding domain-containing protein, partial [Vicinamibacterales bacterium]